MARNTLFNFIKHHVIASKTISLPNCTGLIKDTNKNGCTYYRFDLQINKRISFSDIQHRYMLEDHHISVYEIEKNDDPSLSQYHYTAHFRDEENTRYQLHVYLNDKDVLTKEPIFSIQNEKSDGFTPIRSKQLKDGFVELARSNIEPIMGELRNQLTNKVQGLEDSYNALEKHACTLSTNLDTNRIKYLNTLGKIQKTLGNLIPLVRHDHYDKIQLFVTSIKKSIEQQSTKTNKTSDKAPKKGTTLNATPRTTNSEFSISRKKNRRQHSNHHTNKETLNLAEELNILRSSLTNLSDKSYIDQVRIVSEVYADLNALLLRIEDTSNVLSLTNLTMLKNLHGDIVNMGTNLLHALIKEKHYAIAGQLRAFHYLLTVQFLAQTLKNRDSALLNFILENGDFAINDQRLTIKGKSYTSAVQYCSSVDSKETPMADCLSILIKHGASVFIKGEDGLPLAYSILSDSKHPLRPAFTSLNKNQTVESISFYRRLITELRYYLSENTLDGANYEKISEAISEYSSRIEALRVPSSRLRQVQNNNPDLGFSFFMGTFSHNFFKASTNNLRVASELEEICEVFEFF